MYVKGSPLAAVPMEKGELTRPRGEVPITDLFSRPREQLMTRVIQCHVLPPCSEFCDELLLWAAKGLVTNYCD